MTDEPTFITVSDMDDPAFDARTFTNMPDLINNADEIEAAKKPPRTGKAALEMKVRGASDAEIAELLGYATPQAARAAWETVLGNLHDPTANYETVRSLAVSRLEAQIKTLSPRAFSQTKEVPDLDAPGHTKIVNNDEHIAYNTMLLRVTDRWIKLLGLDAPQVVTVRTPDVQEFERVIGLMRSVALGEITAEGNIFDEEDDNDDEDVDAVVE